MKFDKIKEPESGSKITITDGQINVPNNPIIPFIEGDGIGVDITPAMLKVVDNAVKVAYEGERKIEWMEVYCGEKSTHVYTKDTWLPDETIEALREYVVSIKGPLTTPIGGGIRSLNVSLRQILDLYVCLRPIRYFDGVPSPVKRPQDTDMIIFRENSEDIYSGIEFKAESDESKKVVEILKKEFGIDQIRFPDTVGIGVKPISKEGTERLVTKAIDYAIDNDRSSVTLVHKGNIMKYTEGAFRDWGYEVSKTDYQAENAIVVNSLEKALKVAEKDDQPFIIGGGEIYRLSIDIADRVELTRVHTLIEGDTSFPEINLEKWKEVKREKRLKDEKNEYDFSFLRYDKIN